MGITFLQAKGRFISDLVVLWHKWLQVCDGYIDNWDDNILPISGQLEALPLSVSKSDTHVIGRVQQHTSTASVVACAVAKLRDKTIPVHLLYHKLSPLHYLVENHFGL